IALDPGNLTYRVDYAKIIYEHEDNPEAAIGFLREILKDYPDHPQVLGAIAIYYRRSGQLKYFEDTKKEIMNLPNKDTTFYTFMMEAAQLDENTDLVISYGRELLKLEQGNLNVRMQVAKTLYEKGDLQQALLELEEIKRKLPSYPRLYYYLSKIYSVQGKIDLSLEMAKKEVESNPTLEYGHIQLGNIYTQKEQFSEAQNAFETAQKINGKSVEALMGLAWIKYRQNHVESALDLYTKAAQLDQGNPLVHKQLGFVYKAIGQHILAVQEFKTYLDLSPNADDRAKIQSYIDLLQ
ncbi:MAG: tetratricopeptide repeat protein, partial [Bacteriovoracaceae bacterium]|nr:tetratricopeptide repeat protein [Bacteriovoracaceae bacterium]